MAELQTYIQNNKNHTINFKIKNEQIVIKSVNDFLSLVYRCGGNDFPKDIIVEQLSILTPVIE